MSTYVKKGRPPKPPSFADEQHVLDYKGATADPRSFVLAVSAKEHSLLIQGHLKPPTGWRFEAGRLVRAASDERCAA